MFTASQRLTVRRTAALVAGLTAAVAVGATATAQLTGGDEGADSPPSPGTPIGGDPTGSPSDERSRDALITTDGANFDPTILTQFLPGTSFDPYQGAALEADIVDYESPDSTCVSADSTAGGSVTEFRRGVELPDGARIKQIIFYGSDDDVTRNIAIRIARTTVTVPSGGEAPTKSFAMIDAFDTGGSSGVVALAGTDDLNEVVGSSGDEHRFHTLHVQLWNAAVTNHRLCGVEVLYQVPVQSPEGSVFHPVAPYRAYDSREEMAPVPDGLLSRGPGRLIPVKDGRDVLTGVINQPNAIPANATAVAYTLTVDRPTGFGFLFIAPGDATEVTASSINWDSNTSGAIANSGIVKLDGARQVKVFAGGASSANFIIDITGYFGPPVHPNMGG